jgi:hypothetical protein
MGPPAPQATATAQQLCNSLGEPSLKHQFDSEWVGLGSAQDRTELHDWLSVP